MYLNIFFIQTINYKDITTNISKQKIGILNFPKLEMK